jgi:hypothetical protein
MAIQMNEPSPRKIMTQPLHPEIHMVKLQNCDTGRCMDEPLDICEEVRVPKASIHTEVVVDPIRSIPPPEMLQPFVLPPILDYTEVSFIDTFSSHRWIKPPAFVEGFIESSATRHMTKNVPYQRRPTAKSRCYKHRRWFGVARECAPDLRIGLILVSGGTPYCSLVDPPETFHHVSKDAFTVFSIDSSFKEAEKQPP